MSKPSGFSWIERPLLAGLARPSSLPELEWLRSQGIEVLISLTEDQPHRRWVNEAGLMLVHEAIVDMEPPTQEQLERCVQTIVRANANGLGVAVHCEAGLGRTGTILAGYIVEAGSSAKDAIAKIRRLRPGSIETTEQADSVFEYARRRKGG